MKLHSNEFWFAIQVVIVCILWYSSSSIQSITNKYTLKKYPYPLTIALSSIINNVIYAVPLIKILHINPVRVSSKYVLQTIVPISLGRALAVSSAYFGLWKVSVSYAQTVKATLPIFTVLISRFIINERQSSLIYFSLSPIVIGVFIATFTEIEFDINGLILSLFSTFAFAYLNVLAKKVFKETGMHPIFLLNLNSQLASVFLFPAWLFYDGYSMWSNSTTLGLSKEANLPPDLHFLLCLIVSGACSFVQNLCAFALIHQLTTLSYSVSNAAKRIFVILLSLITLGNPVTAMNLFGMMLSILGVFIYNRTKASENSKRNFIDDMSLKNINGGEIMLRRHPEEKGPLSNIRTLHSSESDVRLSLSVQ